MEKEVSFFVTNRDYETIASRLNLTPEYIENIPKNSKVLEIGSGLNQSFARGLSKLRPDLKIVSLDPSLAINPKEFKTRVIRNEDGDLESVYYTNSSKDYSGEYYSFGRLEDSKKVQQERIENAMKTGLSLAGKAPELPFRENTFDLIVDSFGPILYLQGKKQDQLISYFRRIYNILKVGGEFRAYPATIVDENILNITDADDKTLNLSSIEYFKKLLKKSELNFEKEFIDNLNNHNTSKNKSSDVLIILKKK